MSSLISGGMLVQASGLPWIPIAVTDFKDRSISLTLPLQRIVVLDMNGQILMACQLLGIGDLLVVVDCVSGKNQEFFPEGFWGSIIGDPEAPDISALCALNSDLVLVGNLTEKTIIQMEKACLNVASISVFPNQYDGFLPVPDLLHLLNFVTSQDGRISLHITKSSSLQVFP